MILSNWSKRLLFAFVLFTAAQTWGAGNQGVFEVRIKDHREAIDDFAKLPITVDQLLISPKPGLKFWQSGWKNLAAGFETVDLTKYVGKTSATVFRGSIDTGSFDAIHLKLKPVDGVLKKSAKKAQIKNLVGPIKIPFEIHPQSETTIVFDLVVLDMADHPPRAYELAIKGWELYVNGKLIDSVPPGN
jgi:hypothetical protein